MRSLSALISANIGGGSEEVVTPQGISPFSPPPFTHSSPSDRERLLLLFQNHSVRYGAWDASDISAMLSLPLFETLGGEWVSLGVPGSPTSRGGAHTTQQAVRTLIS